MPVVNDILKSASQAMRTGRVDNALALLKAGLSEHPNNIDILRAQSITHQKAKNLPAALAAIDRAVEHHPEDISAWVMKGAIHEAMQAQKDALQAYGCVLALAQHATALPAQLEKQIAQVSQRQAYLVESIERNLSDQLSELDFDPDSEDRRFGDAVDILFGRKQIYVQEPQQFYFPELPQKPVYDPYAFDWAEDLESRWEAIKAEALSVIQDKSLFAPYLQSEAHIPGSDQMDLANSMDWSSFYLIKDGEDVPDNQARCPVTTEALKSVDLCRTGGGTPSVLFSLLQPGAHIPPHTGMINTRLICHLPLIVPGDCEIRVGNHIHKWQEGKLFVFDDTIEHEAWNRSGKDRLILLLDVWRPEITPRERKLIDIVLSAR